MRKWLILLSAMSAITAHGAPAWTWVDASGQVHFSDRPVPGARQIELSGAQGFGVPVRAPAATPTDITPPPASAATAYTLEITSPAEQETLWNIGTMLNVQLSVEPALQPGHRFAVMLDGERRNLSSTNSQFVLGDVFRGMHTLQALVVDSSGTAIARSPSRVFFVQQTSIQNRSGPPARPPAPRGGN